MHGQAAAGMETLIAPAINLAVLIGILYWKLRQPLTEYIQSRHHSVAQNLKQAQDVLKEAQNKYEEFSSKLKSVDLEVGALRNEARKDAQATKARIAVQAKKLSENIQTDAHAASATLLEELREELHRELGHKALHRAEQILIQKITAEDRGRIRTDFVRQMEASR